MAGTIADTALSIIAATASDAGLQLAVNWINQRYAEFCAHARVNQNRRYGSLYAPSPITVGTVTATTGSTSITFAAQPVDPVSGALVAPVGWQIRIVQQWYFIVSGGGAGPYILDSAYSETPAGSGLSFTLVKRYLPVADANARWVSSVIHQRRRKRLDFKPFDTVQSLYSGRTLVTAVPWCWTEAPRFIGTTDISSILGTTGQKFIEVYPPSATQETYTYIYWTLPRTFLVTDTLPPEIDEYVLREGVLVDVYRYKSEQWAAKVDKGIAGAQEMAAYYSNKEARQMTVWQQKIQEAIVTDALFHNQVALEIDMFHDHAGEIGDLETAREWIITGWPQ